MDDQQWVSGFQGAAGGAMAGGSMAGPWGAAIGGGLGLLGGLFGNPDQQRQKQMLQDYYNSIANRAAPTMGPTQTSSYSDFRQNQANLIKRLEAMASGQGPSLAAQQAQQSLDTNLRQQQAMTASGRGGAMANLTAANNMAGMGTQSANQAVMGRTAEEMGAIGQLGGVINQGRGADEQTNMFNAQSMNQAAYANLDARLRTMGMNDQARMAIMGQMMGMNAQPTMGQQILGGGAGMMALGASQKGSGRGGNMGGGGGGGGIGMGQTLTPPGFGGGVGGGDMGWWNSY